MGCFCSCCLPRSYDLTEENILAAEQDLLSLSGLPEDQIKSMYVEVGTHEGKPMNIRTSMVGSHDKPILVMVHGYGSTGSLFFKLFRTLSEHFYVIVIDVLGVGVSSRDNDYDQDRLTAEDSTQYFVDKLEKWRVEVGKQLPNGELKDFFLVGHSFGGWMVGNYMAITTRMSRRLCFSHRSGSDRSRNLIQSGGAKFSPIVAPVHHLMLGAVSA